MLKQREGLLFTGTLRKQVKHTIYSTGFTVEVDNACPETGADDVPVIDVTRLRREAATLSGFTEGRLRSTVFAE